MRLARYPPQGRPQQRRSQSQSAPICLIGAKCLRQPPSLQQLDQTETFPTSAARRLQQDHSRERPPDWNALFYHDSSDRRLVGRADVLASPKAFPKKIDFGDLSGSRGRFEPASSAWKRDSDAHRSAICFFRCQKSAKSSRRYRLSIGAGEGIRTLDPNLGKVVLYP